MDAQLADLLTRLSDKSDLIIAPGFDSTKTISWKARREAEKLHDEKLVQPLMNFIAKESDAAKRDSAYFVLAQIALNTGNEAAAPFIVQQLAAEQDDDLRISMLLHLKPLSKSKGTDLQPVISYLTSENEQLRQAAIQALQHAESSAAEEALVNIVKGSKDQADVVLAIEALKSTGTSRAVLVLDKHGNSPVKELRMAATEALDYIRKRK